VLLIFGAPIPKKDSIMSIALKLPNILQAPLSKQAGKQSAGDWITIVIRRAVTLFIFQKR
jgi:hypothetical protein